MWGNSMQNDDMHSAGSCMASGQPPDDALILRIAQGDTAALEVLYRQTSSSIYGFALSILRDPVAAEDVMQDSPFLNLYYNCVAEADSLVGCVLHKLEEDRKSVV